MMDNMPYLIAGLGNPGRKYRQNRHNVGFMVVNALADEIDTQLKRVQFRALIGKGAFRSKAIVLAKPQTYMNESGQSVGPIMRFYRIPKEQLLVVHDDLDLPFGTLRLRPTGGTGGQKGMESIVAQLGTQDFPRLRFGIGRPPGRMDPRDYVLHVFDPPQADDLPFVLDRAVEAILSFISEGIEPAMNAFNGSVMDGD